MAVSVASLSTDDLIALREADANRIIAESGNPNVHPDQARLWIVEYYELVRTLHEEYGLDEDEYYTFDYARGLVFEDRE